MIEENIPTNIDKIFSRLNKFILRCKDTICQVNCFQLKSIRKNMVTKIYTENSVYNKPLVFLIGVSLFDAKGMQEIVKAGLESIDKRVETDLDLDEQRVSVIRDFIFSHNNLSVDIFEEKIYLSSGNNRLEIFTMYAEDSSKYLFVRSLCVFLAICGKSVSNNIDEVELNDYGRI